MKEKLSKDVTQIGTKVLDYDNLKFYEAVSMTIVGVLAIALGTLYGTVLY